MIPERQAVDGVFLGKPCPREGALLKINRPTSPSEVTPKSETKVLAELSRGGELFDRNGQSVLR